MVFTSRDPPGTPLGRLEVFFGRLGAILSVLERSLGDSKPSWTVLNTFWGALGSSLGPLGSEKVTRQDAGSPTGHATSPGRFGNFALWWLWVPATFA